jgi:hypothetical protein
VTNCVGYDKSVFRDRRIAHERKKIIFLIEKT